MFSVSYPCSLCKSTCDPYGDQQIEYGSNKDHIHWYDSIRDALFSSAQSAALCPRKEVPSLIPGSKSHPADIYLPHWTHGKPVALDVSVISPLQRLTLENSSMSQGHALSVGEYRKHSTRSDACRKIGVSFVPLLVKTIGGWSEMASQTITSIGRLLGWCLGSNPEDTIRHLFQCLSIFLWWDNLTMWLTRSPISLPSIDGII